MISMISIINIYFSSLCIPIILSNPININFKGTLRDYQVPIVNLIFYFICTTMSREF